MSFPLRTSADSKNMSLYKTIGKRASVEQIIEKSRFIGHICPVENREEAEAFIAGIRAQYKDATHNVPAMVLGDQFQIQWASDDGEPQGTSGAPMVQMLTAQGVTNVALVVTRYFGGIKLGPGGLVRAYTGTARLALEEAGIVEVKEREFFLVEFAYPYLDKLQHLAAQGSFSLEDLTYAEMVGGLISAPPEDSEELLELLNQVTSGTVKILERKIRETR